ncbi:nucleotidyltransferase domain-containing protein [bacterium]|nr:nucleotidyltransferase domain-containing protein [bacterium]
MIKGVTKEEEQIIKAILKDFSDKYSFYYYGSRVKGNFEQTSDLDILIKGERKMPLAVFVELKERFDESKLPYITNFTDYFSIDKDFYKLIVKDLVEINLF